MNVLLDAVWRHAAGLIRAEDLPMIAAEALARRVDSPSLRELAGLSRLDRADEILLLYLAAMDELGITVPTTEQAVTRQLHDLAAALVAGGMDPLEVARRLGPGESWMTETESGLAHLAYYRDDFFDLAQPEQVRLFEADLRAAAESVVNEASGRARQTRR